MSKISQKTLKQRLDQAEAEADAEAASFWHVSPQQNVLLNNPRFQTIVAVLQAEPLLMAPVEKWLLQKRAEMAQAQLSVLYSQEELDAMYAKAAKG